MGYRFTQFHKPTASQGFHLVKVITINTTKYLQQQRSVKLAIFYNTLRTNDMAEFSIFPLAVKVNTTCKAKAKEGCAATEYQ